MSVLLILGAIPGFFFASWLVMIMLGAFVASPTGIPPIGYWTSTLVTITLWMGVTPLIAASRRKKGKC